MIFQNLDSVHKLLQFKFLQILLEIFFRMVHCILRPAPIACRTRLLFAPAVVQDTSRQLGVRSCTTLCAFCCGSVTPPQGPFFGNMPPPTKPEIYSVFHVCCPFRFGKGAMMDGADRLRAFLADLTVICSGPTWLDKWGGSFCLSDSATSGFSGRTSRATTLSNS